MSDFRLPNNAEGSLVGCLLLHPETRETISGLITEGDFSSSFYAALFTVAATADDLDSVVLREEMKKRGFSIPDSFFRELCDIVIIPANAELYATLLRESAMQRNLLGLSEKIREAVEGETAPRDIIAAAESTLHGIEGKEITRELADPAAALTAFFDHRARVDSGEGAVATGLAPLDKLLCGGFLRSGVYIIAARPGMGKTTLALSVADSMAASGGILFVSLEMSTEQLQGKRISRVSGIPSDRILLQKIDDEAEYSKMVRAAEQLQSLPLFINRKPAATVADVSHMARRVPDLRAIFIDYFGLLTPSGRFASRYEAMTSVSRDLKQLAISANVPVVVLAQLNRELSNRQDKRPQLSDLRDTGAIEQDADGVLMLHRPDYYEAAEQPVSPHEAVQMEIILRKNRHGKVGTCKVAAFFNTGRIYPAM